MRWKKCGLLNGTGDTHRIFIAGAPLTRRLKQRSAVWRESNLTDKIHIGHSSIQGVEVNDFRGISKYFILMEVSQMHYADIGQGDPLVFIHRYWVASRNRGSTNMHFPIIIDSLFLIFVGTESAIMMKRFRLRRNCRRCVSPVGFAGHHTGAFLWSFNGRACCTEIYRQKPDCVQTMILSNTFSYTPSFFGNLSLQERMNDLSVAIDS